VRALEPDLVQSAPTHDVFFFCTHTHICQYSRSQTQMLRLPRLLSTRIGPGIDAARRAPARWPLQRLLQEQRSSRPGVVGKIQTCPKCINRRAFASFPLPPSPPPLSPAFPNMNKDTQDIVKQPGKPLPLSHRPRMALSKQWLLITHPIPF